jgi:hypothetical protein
MSKLPITFKKVKTKTHDNNEMVSYLVTVSDKTSYWDKSSLVDRNELLKLRDELDKVLSDISTAELLSVSENHANFIDESHKKDYLCKNCNYKMTQSCVTCLFTLDSPLERKLFLELKKIYIKFIPQYGIDWKGNEISIEGKSYNDATNNFKNVLTIADFFIQKKDAKLCIYTDGHTFHEKTEEQAKHDKTIDRQLQLLGYTVLRYTGKEVNEDCDKIIAQIKKFI